MQKIKKALEKNGFSVYIVKNKKEALELSKSFLKDISSVGLGGSTTVVEIGLLDYLTKLKGIKLHNQYEPGISMEENLKRRREGLLSDLYITSSNAVTKDGVLVNADGSGNRVSAQIFGPEKVLLIIGKNKVVNDIKEGFKRIMEYVAPKNCERMNNKLKEMGKEPRYNLDNIANKFTYITGDEEGRTHIILVEEELGY